MILAAFNNEAVLDKNTGLVWEKSPATTPRPWGAATVICLNRTVGGQRGWRLPAVAELASLTDPSVASPGPLLPSGHPFLNGQSAGGYRSATTNAYPKAPSDAWDVDSFNGDPSSHNIIATLIFVWCVRGPMQASVY